MKTKALIRFAVTAPLFSHMQNVGFLMTLLKYCSLISSNSSTILSVPLQNIVLIIYKLYQ